MNKTLLLFDRRVRYMIAASLLILSTVVIPVLASAAQVTERSVQLSSSSVNATGVEYQINFTAVGAADAVVVDFCNDSPVIGDSCTAPTGMVVTGAASTDPDVTAVTGTGHQLDITTDITADEDVSLDITGINNPTETGPLYARIVTFTTANAGNYSSADPDNSGANPYVDAGGVALSITDTIGVSGVVQESMTFCVTKTAPTANCANADGNLPVVELGETVGTQKALTAGALSTDSIFSQISTNAAGGAVVHLKSNAEGCGGLIRAEDTNACDIEPSPMTGTIAAGDALFGVRANTAAGVVGADPFGTFQPAATSSYNTTDYRFNYVDGDATGVTSTYGDPFLDTDDAPVSNQNMEITFGASVSNATPAGSYSTDLSMIAVGKF